MASFTDESSSGAETLRGSDVILLVAFLTPGGTERQSYLLARSMAETGGRVGVIVWSLTSDDYYLPHFRALGVPFVVAPQVSKWRKVTWLRSIVQRARPKVLHAMTFFLNAPAAFAMAGLDGIAVGSIRGSYEAEREHGSVHYAVNRRWPRWLVTNSRATLRSARCDKGFFRPRNIEFIPNGLDLDHVGERVSHDGLKIIGVGNLYPGKRWDRLIRIVSKVVRDNSDLDFDVDIVGSGREMDALSSLASSLGVSDRIHFLGRRYDVSELLRRSDIFVLTSDSEGMPNAVLEAMAAGLAVVSTSVGDLPWAIECGRDGFLLSPADEVGFASILAMLLKDSELRVKVGREGREKCRRLFSLASLAANAKCFYARAASSRADERSV